MFKFTPIKKPEPIKDLYKIPMSVVREEFEALSVTINQYIAIMSSMGIVIIFPVYLFVLYLIGDHSVIHYVLIIFVIFYLTALIYVGYVLIIGVREIIYMFRIRHELLKIVENEKLIPKYKIKYLLIRLAMIYVFLFYFFYQIF